MKLRMLLLVPVIALSACVGTTSNFFQNSEALVAQSCEAYRRALGVANDFKPIMGPDHRRAIQASIEVVPGLCLDAATASETGAPFDYLSALDRIAAQLGQINHVNRELAR